jgi:hypothetical protein
MTDYHATIHELKVLPAYYVGIRDGSKPFELRIDDRPYAVNDLLILREWDATLAQYTGFVTVAVVTYVLRATEHLAPGYVALGIRRLT